MEEKGKFVPAPHLAAPLIHGPRTMAAFVVLVALCVSRASRVGLGDPARTRAGSATIVIHGQGRVTSEPAGAIDCPGRCTLAFTGSTQLTLRAAPATGWETEQLAFCVKVDVCTVALNDFTYKLDVYFRPRAELQLWPRGDGAITVSPPPADGRGAGPPSDATRRTRSKGPAAASTTCREPGDGDRERRPRQHVPRLEPPTVRARGRARSRWPRRRLARRPLHAARGARDPGGHRPEASSASRRDSLPADVHRAVRGRDAR